MEKTRGRLGVTGFDEKGKNPTGKAAKNDAA